MHVQIYTPVLEGSFRIQVETMLRLSPMEPSLRLQLEAMPGWALAVAGRFAPLLLLRADFRREPRPTLARCNRAKTKPREHSRNGGRLKGLV